MTAVRTLQLNMTRGEITPLMHQRIDSDMYQAGLKKCQNFVVTRYGGVVRAPGFLYHGANKNTTEKTYFIRFRFNRSQVYAIELADLALRFWTAAGQVMNGGSPYEIVSPYAAADVSKIQYWQSGDVLYLTCDGYRVKKLTRSGETDWAFSDYDAEDGPYENLNETDTTLDIAGDLNSVPDLTSNSGTSPYVAKASNNTADAWKAFNRNEDDGVQLAGGSTGYIRIDLGAGNEKVADAYWLMAAENNAKNDNMFSSWSLQGSQDASNWTTLDSRNGEEGWAGAEKRFYEFTNSTAWRYYRVKFTGGGGSDATDSSLGLWGLNQAADDQTSFNLTASATTGINNDEGFKATDVGRTVRILGSDGKWRWFEITEYTSTTVVKVIGHGHAFLETEPTLNWRIGAWSDTSGWPKSVGSFEDRAVFANTDEDPFGIWASKSADYDSFAISDPLVADDGIAIRPTTNRGGGLNPVNWIAGDTNILIGTEGQLKAIGPRNLNEAFGPENNRQLNSANTPTGLLQPIFDNNILMYPDIYGRRLFEAAFSTEADGYVSQEVSVLNEHLLREGITRWDFQQVPHRVIWAATTSGKLLAITYDKEQKVFAVAPRLVDGFVDDVIVLPGDTQDDLLVSVRRTVDGNTVNYTELLANFFDENEDNYPVYYDCAAVFTGSGVTVVTGAGHIEGETVGIWVDGVDVGDAVVASGQFTIPGGVSGDTIVYGCRIKSRLETLRISNWGQQTGVAIGPQSRIIDAYVDLYQAYGLKFGTLTDLDDWEPEVPESGAPTLITGSIETGALDDAWSNNGIFVVETDRGYPASVLSVTTVVEGAD